MTPEIAIVGAGPYGLATAAHLKQLGVPAHVFGETMGAWARMPAGMLLRSFREATNIGDPDARLGIDAFAAERGRKVPTPVPLADFIEYGKWFQQHAAPEADARLIERVERCDGGFRLSFSDGSTVEARAVVVAAGIEPFAYVPQELRGLNDMLVSHSSQHVTFDRFAGRRVVIVGAGQSALEWAVLAAEAGADVEVLTRRAAALLAWRAPARPLGRLPHNPLSDPRGRPSWPELAHGSSRCVPSPASGGFRAARAPFDSTRRQLRGCGRA